LVTTPNVFRWQHLIYLLYKSHNLFHPYSGHGVYGRHQREYSPTELTDLVQGCGFKAVRTEIADFEECNKWSERIAKRLWPLRRDNIFLLAQREAKRCFYYPSWLYIATQNIHRVIDSDVRMGINDVGHLGRGWWDAEPIPGGHARWTMDEARIYLARPDAGGHEIVVEATGMVTALGPISVTLMVGQHERQFRMTGDEWRQLVLSWSGESDAGEVTLGIRVEPTRVPKERSVNADTRALGLMVRRIYIR
jgi:hypothetical protein